MAELDFDKTVYIGTAVKGTPAERGFENAYHPFCWSVAREAEKRDLTLREYVVLRVGEPTRDEKSSGVVWDRPKWRLRLLAVPKGVEIGYDDPMIVQSRGRLSLVLEVPENTGWEAMLGAYKDFRDALDPEIELRQEAAALAAPILADMVPQEFTRMADEELRKFVLAYTAGQVFTSADLEGRGEANLLLSVFMPLAFGALDHPKWPLPEKPPEPVEPVAPTKPQDIPKPELPGAREYDPALPAAVARLENALSWDDAVEAELAEARRAVEADRQAVDEANAALEEQHRTLLADWEAACQQQDQAWLAARSNYEKAKASFDLAREREKHARTCRVLDMAGSLLVNAYFRDLGIIWEYLGEAAPRAINGCPMFFSCHLMHREDWERARAAINREFERRESIEL